MQLGSRQSAAARRATGARTVALRQDAANPPAPEAEAME
jgi:hypothetical protein